MDWELPDLEPQLGQAVRRTIDEAGKIDQVLAWVLTLVSAQTGRELAGLPESRDEKIPPSPGPHPIPQKLLGAISSSLDSRSPASHLRVSLCRNECEREVEEKEEEKI